MSREERNAIVFIMVNFGVNLWVALKLWGLWQAGALAGPDGLQVWAQAILWAMPVAIGITIGVTILAAILHHIISPDLEKVTDERDKAYQLRGMAATMIVASIGMIAAVIAAAIGHSGLFTMTVVYFSMALGSLAGDATKLLSYRVWG